ncbi:MAG: alpha/beta hydrolase [Turicibacter sp.]
MKKKILMIGIIVVCVLTLITKFAVDFGVKTILMSDRKDATSMLEELWDNFETDYRNYQDIPVEKVTIKSEDGLNLTGYYHEVFPDSDKVVIINHGYTANHFVTYQYTDVFFEEGYNVLLVDMRSHGESEGDFASYSYYEEKDMGQWVDFVKDRVGEDAYIGLHGQSMGAATVLAYGGHHEDEVKFVIEDCGYTTAREAIKFQFGQANIPFWPLYDLVQAKVNRTYEFDLNEISPSDVIVNSDVPTLFIHGTADSIVPSYMAEEMYRLKNDPKDRLYLVEGADHMESSVKNKELYKEAIREFLSQVD